MLYRGNSGAFGLLLWCCSLATVLCVPCTLPPDFWCDSALTAIECTGSLTYCDRYRASRLGKPMQLGLAFESACPDSQRFVIDRLYPRVLNNSQISQLVDFKAYPWGLAKRETAEKVSCHHGARECVGNRLLTCMMNYFTNDKRVESEVFFCFMSLMFNKQQDPQDAFRACMRQARASPVITQTIEACSKSAKVKTLQRVDEMQTRRILTQPRFVPFISLNGHSHIQMQAYQIFLAEKLRAWDSTLQRIVPTSGAQQHAQQQSCDLPSDFWCMDPTATRECYDAAGCSAYSKAIWGKPLHFRVIYADDQVSRNYVLGYLKRNFLLNSAANRKQAKKVVVELEPAASSSNPCGAVNCNYQSVQHCVASHVKADINTRNQMLLCLMESGGDMLESWQSKCHTFKPEYRNTVAECVRSGAWKGEVAARAQAQGALKPEPPRQQPWILINDYSLSTVQPFAELLDRMICIWYRGPGHDRDACFRCEYEMTHCRG